MRSRAGQGLQTSRDVPGRGFRGYRRMPPGVSEGQLPRRDMHSEETPRAPVWIAICSGRGQF